VLHLTEQRDELPLLHSLQESLLEMLPAVQMAIIALAPDPDGGQLVQDSLGPVPEPMFPVTPALVAEVGRLDTATPMSHWFQGGQSYLISALGAPGEGRRKAIAIRQPDWPEADERTAIGMLKIYGNYARILADSERDTLTGLYNRKKLEQKLSELLISRGHGRQRENDPGKADYLAILDLDHFKRINDTFGHLIGDEVLLVFANLMCQALRDEDWVFRYGGEEFVVLVKDVSPSAISCILERLRVRVQEHVFPQVGRVRVSVGYTVIDGQALPPYVFEEADQALYYAKANGRNRVCGYRALVDGGALAPETHLTGSVELFT